MMLTYNRYWCAIREYYSLWETRIFFSYHHYPHSHSGPE